MKSAFSLLVKPVSFDCNLRCRYCFYLKKSEFFGKERHCMSHAVLERMIASYLRSEQEVYSFGWQGGEPTLAGLDFYRAAVGLMQTHGRRGAVIANALQTNGTLLNDEWAEFLARYRFLVGVSLDGPPDLHDANRTDGAGNGSHTAVLNGIAALRRHRVEFNTLTLVNAVNAAAPLRVYRYLRDDLRVNFHQYIECVEHGEDGTLLPFAVTPERWGEFLCTLFDEWYAHDMHTVSVRLFDSILHRLAHGVANTCAMSRQCGQYLVVEHDGSLYPCDFSVQPSWRLGSVERISPEEALRSPRARTFARRKADLTQECRSCQYLRFCAGDCTKNRVHNHSLLCAGWKMFYQHTLERFEKIADTLR